jgi:hypothetical protein
MTSDDPYDPKSARYANEAALNYVNSMTMKEHKAAEAAQAKAQQEAEQFVQEFHEQQQAAIAEVHVAVQNDNKIVSDAILALQSGEPIQNGPLPEPPVPTQPVDPPGIPMVPAQLPALDPPKPAQLPAEPPADE